MIFMLANTISCIVTSVLLNIVDHRQVRRLAACVLCKLTLSQCAACWLDVLFFHRAGPWTRRLRSRGRQRETQTESHSIRQRRSKMTMRMTGLPDRVQSTHELFMLILSPSLNISVPVPHWNLITSPHCGLWLLQEMIDRINGSLLNSIYTQILSICYNKYTVFWFLVVFF